MNTIYARIDELSEQWHERADSKQTLMQFLKENGIEEKDYQKYFIAKYCGGE